jgi:predicted nucleic acid-binding protein
VARIVLDTDVVSLHRRGHLPAGLARHLAANDLCITFVTAGELYKGAIVGGWGEARRGALDVWLDLTMVLPYDGGVARTWGVLAAEAQRRGRRRPDNDTWIAACCLQDRLPLLTHNRRDFADFADHHGLVLLAG